MSGSSLTCPKCDGVMRTYERSGVTVDQCGECRGIFLDRGELDRLIDAERNWHSDDSTPRDARYQPSPPHRHERTGYREHGGHNGYAHDDYSRKRRKKSFLDELFD
jgi:Zn-finger nucleic acid-binding protein